MILRIDGTKARPVRDFAEASATWRELRDANGWGASDAPDVLLIDGKMKYRVSYNGTVWEGRAARKLVYDPATDFGTQGNVPGTPHERKATFIPALLAKGFKLETTGGNCTGYMKRMAKNAGSASFHDGAEILITCRDEAFAPESDTDLITVGFYDNYGTKIAGLRFANVAEFLARLEEETG